MLASIKKERGNFDTPPIAEGFDQVSFEGTVPYFLVDEKEEVLAVGYVRLEEQRFDL